MILFFLYACFNVGIADPKLFGLFELSKMIRGMTIFLAVAFYLRSERELRLLILGLGLVVCYEGTLALRQRYFWGLHRVPGTLDDSNSLSVFLCTTAPFFVAAITSRIPKALRALSALAIALACLGVVLTISRAGVVIIALVLLGAAIATVSVRFTPKKVLITLLIVLAATGVTLKSWKTLQTRFETVSFADEYTKKKTLGRGYYIRVAAAIAEDRWFGVGLNNWSYWVSQKYGRKLGYRFVPYRGTDREPSLDVPPGSNVDEAQAAPAHSLAALTAGELGIPGLVLFSVLWLRWFQMGASFLWPRIPDPMRRMGVGILFGLCGIFLQSLTEWVFRHSPIYYTIHILLGALAALYYVKRQEKRAATVLKPEPEESLSPQYSRGLEEPVPAGSMGYEPCSP
jgi:O-antigen ligase